jgi:DNA-binding MarR family transcriptional regulator
MNKDKVRKASLIVSELIPGIIKGAQVDFLFEQKITQLQFITLITVSYFEPCPMSKLAANMRMSLPQATQIVERLINAGLLKREDAPSDRRIVLVRLTAKGEGCISNFKVMISKRWSEVLQNLNEDELDLFIKLTSKLSEEVRKI